MAKKATSDNLFGYENKVIEIEIPSHKYIISAAERYEYVNKSLLYDALSFAINYLAKSTLTIKKLPSASDTDVTTFNTVLKKKSQSYKPDLAHFAAIVFGTANNVKPLLEIMPSPIVDLIDLSITERYLDYNRLPDKYKDCFLIDGNSWYQSLVFTPTYNAYNGFFSLGASKYGYYSHSGSSSLVHMQDGFLRSLQSLFMPREAELKSYDIAPVAKYSFNAEQYIAQEFEQVKWLFENDKIEIDRTASSNNLKSTVITDFARLTNVAEFFDKSAPAKARRLRTALFAEIACQYKDKEMSGGYEKLLFDKALKFVNTYAADYYIFNHIKVRGRFEINTYPEISKIFKLIKSDWHEGWYLMSDLLKLIKLNYAFAEVVDDIFEIAKGFITNTFVFCNSKTGYNIGVCDTFENICYAAAYFAIYLLAAVGIVEIRYNDVEEGDATYYSNIVAFKVTQLGRLAMGLESDYKRVKSEGNAIYLDENRLLIRLENKNVVGAKFIEDIGTRIAENRYKVTAKSFINKTTKSSDLTKRIDTFKDLVGGDLPKIWQDFFNKLLGSMQPLREQSLVDYRMFMIEDIHPEIRQIIMEDDRLRSIVIRMSNGMLMVEKSQCPKLVGVLAEYGYTLGI